MREPKICVFSLSKAEEFPEGIEQVAKWIVDKSKTEGRYYFRKRKPRDLPVGATVLFSIEGKIVGEGIVKKGVRPTPLHVRNRLKRNEGHDYPYYLVFEPSTLTVYKRFPSTLRVERETRLKFGRLFTYIRNREQYRTILKMADSSSIDKEKIEAPLKLRPKLKPKDTRTRIWKISPGRGGRQWRTWKQKGIMGIGWFYPKYVENLREFKNIASLSHAFARAQDPSPYYAAEQCWIFCNEIKIGDIIVAYSRYSILDIGRVHGRYYFKSGDDDENWKLCLHRRKVTWFEIGPIKLTDEKARKFMRQEKTLFEITDKVTLNLVDDLLQRSPEYSFVDSTQKEIRKALGSEIKVIVETSNHLKKEIESAKRKIAFPSTLERIDIDRELRRVRFENPPERIQYAGLVRVQRSINILAPTDLEKIKILGHVLYLPPNASHEGVDVSLIREFSTFIYNILQAMTSPDFATNMIGISLEEPYRDAHRFKNIILFNANHYSKNKSIFYWLFTAAREVAYLINRRRDERHMKIMRELAVRALEKLGKRTL